MWAGIASAGKLPGKQVCIVYTTRYCPLNYHALATVLLAFQTNIKQNTSRNKTDCTALTDGSVHTKLVLKCDNPQVPPLTRVGEVCLIGHGEGVLQQLLPPDLFCVFTAIVLVLGLTFELSVNPLQQARVQADQELLPLYLPPLFEAHLEPLTGLQPELCGLQPNQLSVPANHGPPFLYCAFIITLVCFTVLVKSKGYPRVARPISISLSANQLLAWIKFTLIFIYILLSIGKSRQAIKRSDKKITKIVQFFWFFRSWEFASQLPSMIPTAVLAVAASLVWPVAFAADGLCKFEDVKEAWGVLAGWLKINHFVSRPVTERELYNLLSQLVCSTNRLLDTTKAAVLENVDLLVNSTRIDLENSLETTWITLICLQLAILIFISVLIVICKRSACCGRMDADHGGRHLPGAPGQQAVGSLVAGGSHLGARHRGPRPGDGTGVGPTRPQAGDGGAAPPARGDTRVTRDRAADPQPQSVRGAGSLLPGGAATSPGPDSRACVLNLQEPLWSPATTSSQGKEVSSPDTLSPEPTQPETPEAAAQPYGSAASTSDLEQTVWVFNPELSRYIDNLPLASIPQVVLEKDSDEPPPCLTDSDLTDSSSGSSTTSDEDSGDSDIEMPDQVMLKALAPKHELCALALQAKAYTKIMSDSRLPICPASLARSRPSASSNSPKPPPAGSPVMGPKPGCLPRSQPVARDNTEEVMKVSPTGTDSAGAAHVRSPDAGYHSLSDTEKVRRGGWTGKPRPRQMAKCGNPVVAARLKKYQAEQVTRRNANGELLLHEPKQSHVWHAADRSERFSDVLLDTSVGEVAASIYDAALLMVENERKE